MRYGTRCYHAMGDGRWYTELVTDDQDEWLLNAAACYGMVQQGASLRFEVKGEVRSDKAGWFDTAGEWIEAKQHNLLCILWACKERGLR